MLRFVGRMRAEEQRAGSRRYYLTPLPNELLTMLETFLRGQWWHRDHPRRPRFVRRHSELALPCSPAVKPQFDQDHLLCECRCSADSPWQHLLLGAQYYDVSEEGVMVRLFAADPMSGSIAWRLVQTQCGDVWGWSPSDRVRMAAGRDSIFVMYHHQRRCGITVESYEIPTLRLLGQHVLPSPENEVVPFVSFDAGDKAEDMLVTAVGTGERHRLPRLMERYDRRLLPRPFTPTELDTMRRWRRHFWSLPHGAVVRGVRAGCSRSRVPSPSVLRRCEIFVLRNGLMDPIDERPDFVVLRMDPRSDPRKARPVFLVPNSSARSILADFHHIQAMTHNTDDLVLIAYGRNDAVVRIRTAEGNSTQRILQVADLGSSTPYAPMGMRWIVHPNRGIAVVTQQWDRNSLVLRVDLYEPLLGFDDPETPLFGPPV